jgi:hypothetical protein
MLTLFTTPKPFRGHIGVIQRNALKSWTRLGSDVEVILFGDDEGAAEVARDLGIRHEAHVERNESGLKRVDYLFDRAQEIGGGEILSYVNCDIILLDDFVQALARVKGKFAKFLMVGRRWDTDITEVIDFSRESWAESLRNRSLKESRQRDEWYIDYFAFGKGLYHKQIPPLVIGRIYWDNWLVWRAADLGGVVVDASKAVRAIHQNHDYGYHPQGREGVWKDEQAERNFQIAGGFKHLRNMDDAEVTLEETCFKTNLRRYGLTYRKRLRMWRLLLDVSRPLRTALGLRRERR